MLYSAGFFIFYLFIFLIQSEFFFNVNLWAKEDHLLETYLKAHSLVDRYPEWTPNLHSDRSQHSNHLCARGLQGPQSASGSTIPRLAMSLAIFQKYINISVFAYIVQLSTEKNDFAHF